MNKSKHTLLFVCHAGPGIGLGHLSRSKTAACALRDQLNAEITFLIQGTNIDPGYVHDFELETLSFSENLISAIHALALRKQVNVIVLDLFYQRLPENLTEGLSDLRMLGIKLVGIDSVVNYHRLLDLLFIPSFRNPLRDLSPPPSCLVYGWNCFLLNAPKSPEPWASGNKVLILTGGADATSLGKTWPGLLNEQLSPEVELVWVTGPFAQPPTFPEKPRIKIDNQIAPTDLTGLMAQCQYAITVYGVSFFELLGHGIPTVVFSPYGLKDAEELDEITAHKLALVAQDEREATSLLNALMSDDALAKSLSEHAFGKRLYAGQDRFVAEITRLLK